METLTKIVKLAILLTVMLWIDGCKKKDEPIPENQGITVRVIDQKTNKGIPNATVSWVDANGNQTILSPNTSIDGIYRKGGVRDGDYQVTVSAIGYQKLPAGKKMTVEVGRTTEETFQLNPERQISFDKPSPLRINANERATTLRVTNIGNQGPLRISIKSDATSQWLVVTPKDPVTIPKDQSMDVVIALDNKGLNLGEYTSKIQFEYSSTSSTFSDRDEYDIIMSVTTPPVSVAPVISNVLPQAGGYDTNVTITGQNFETDTSKIQVLFGGDRKAVITSASRTELRVKVPVGAKTGNIKVVVANQSGPAVSNAVFTYNLTCSVKSLATLNTNFYINDITTATDGTIYVAGVEFKPNSTEIARTGIYRIPRNTRNETPVLERETGFVNGNLSTARMVYPTKIEAVGADLYVADQYDNTRHSANHTEGYSSIRRIANNNVTTPYYQKLTDKVFIYEMLYVPASSFNGILYADGAGFKKLGLDGRNETLTSYQGFTAFMDVVGTDVYTLDLEPENNPTRWILRRRPINGLQGERIASGDLGISNPALAPDKTNYPKGMAVDPTNQCAYIFDRNPALGFIVYRVGLTDRRVEIIYNASRAATSLENGLLVSDASVANFSNISCLTYSDALKSVVLVDVFRANQVRAMECK